MDVVVVAAVAPNGVIGADGGLPWHYPADLRHFKELTMGSPVIMGRVTYESIADRLGGPLPGRTNIVLTRSGVDLDGAVRVVRSIDDARVAAEETGSETAYVIGGRSIYEQVLERDLADRLVVTEIPEPYEGDTFWPGPELDTLDPIDRTTIDKNLDVVTYSL